MWWQMYFAAVLTKYVVVMYLHRNYIRNGVESGVESGVECSETNVRKLRFGINFQDIHDMNSYLYEFIYLKCVRFQM